MHVSDRVARRHRWRRGARRAGLLLGAALAVGLGMRFYENSNVVRRSSEITIPAAIGRDISEQQRRWGDMIRTIQQLTPAQPMLRPRIDNDSNAVESLDAADEAVPPDAHWPFRLV